MTAEFRGAKKIADQLRELQRFLGEPQPRLFIGLTALGRMLMGFLSPLAEHLDVRTVHFVVSLLSARISSKQVGYGNQVDSRNVHAGRDCR